MLCFVVNVTDVLRTRGELYWSSDFNCLF